MVSGFLTLPPKPQQLPCCRAPSRARDTQEGATGPTSSLSKGNSSVSSPSQPLAVLTAALENLSSSPEVLPGRCTSFARDTPEAGAIVHPHWR